MLSWPAPKNGRAGEPSSRRSDELPLPPRGARSVWSPVDLLAPAPARTIGRCCRSAHHRTGDPVQPGDTTIRRRERIDLPPADGSGARYPPIRSAITRSSSALFATKTWCVRTRRWRCSASANLGPRSRSVPPNCSWPGSATVPTGTPRLAQVPTPYRRTGALSCNRCECQLLSPRGGHWPPCITYFPRSALEHHAYL